LKKTEREPPAFLTAVPEFPAKDLAGRTWQLSDVKGKATLVNFWATWCGPCRGEHPAIQELYGRIKDRSNIQVLTISVDDEDAPVRAYLKDKGYTFPVLQSAELADKLCPYSGLPTNFLVNAHGARSGLYGIGWDSESVTRLIEDLAKVALQKEVAVGWRNSMKNRRSRWGMLQLASRPCVPLFRPCHLRVVLPFSRETDDTKRSSVLLQLR